MILPADTYIVINKTILHNSDRRLLTMLYQPIIGSTSISLYYSLWAYLDKLELMSTSWTFHHLMASTKLSLSEILKAKDLLEGIGLIKTYKEMENNNYIFEIYSPISAYEFLSNPILSTILYNNIGELEYNRTIKYFKSINVNMEKYEDITKNFNNVFEKLNNVNYDIICDEIRKSSKRNLEIVSNIDFDGLMSKFPDELLNKKKINKDLINNLAFIYNFNQNDLEKIILDSINDKKIIDEELLKVNARKYYKFENSGKLPNLVYKENNIKLTDESNKSKLIYQFETTSPYKFLCSKQGGTRLANHDTAILEYLVLELKLNPGVVNVLIDFVLKINNNKLTKSYVDTIASQWKRSNINTAEEAISFVLKEKFKKKNTKQQVKPKWFDEKIENKEMSLEEQKEFENLLKELKNEKN